MITIIITIIMIIIIIIIIIIKIIIITNWKTKGTLIKEYEQHISFALALFSYYEITAHTHIETK